MSPALAEALGELPTLVAAHLLLSGTAVLIGVGIGLPLAIWAAANPRVKALLIAGTGLIQTIPSLALLALFYPLLLALGQLLAVPIPALGFLPALIALALYALLPVVRNTLAALQGIDRAVVEAAKGVGMTRRQRLALVELPLGAPVILAGIRTATVWTIGGATLATTVGQPSLGNLIFSGLQTEDWVRVLVGCAGSALLALAADGLLGLVESGVAQRARWRWVTGLVLLAAALGAALGPTMTGTSDERVVVIGAKNFSEQYILASVIESRLHAAGFATRRRDDLGSAVAYRALAAGDIDVYVDYGGTLWANVLGRKDTPPAEVMRQKLAIALQKRDGVALLGSLGFENAYALAMRRDRARALGIASLDDLTEHARQLRLASDIEFLNRPEWHSVETAYGLRFASTRSFNPTFMYRAIADGSADLLSAFSSDGRIAALDLVTLTDPRGALPSYEAVLLVSPARSKDRGFIDALRPLIGSIPIDRMRQANLMVDRDADKRTPAEAARWLLPSPSKGRATIP